MTKVIHDRQGRVIHAIATYRETIMKLVVLSACMALAATAAQAQAPAPEAPAGRPEAAAPLRERPVRGAVFRIERPDLRLSVRCADGDTTRACGEIVSQMIEKLAAMPPRPARAEGSDPGQRPRSGRIYGEERGYDEDRGPASGDRRGIPGRRGWNDD